MDEEINNNDLKDFCISIDFEKDSEKPERIFEALACLIQTFQKIDENLVGSISSKISPVLLLEDVESGSIKLWLAQFIRSISDDGIKDLSWKKVVGGYLVKAKYLLVNFLEGKTTISNKNEIMKLNNDLLALAEETEIMHIPNYQRMEPQELIHSLSSIVKAVQPLNRKDNVYFKMKSGDTTKFNLDFNIIPDEIEDLFIKERISNKIRLILKVKKPDYLGDSMWEFIYEGKSIVAKILDDEWKESFQNREVDVRPGDSLRVQTEETINYGYNNEVISRKFNIIKVLEVLPFENNTQLSITD